MAHTPSVSALSSIQRKTKWPPHLIQAYLINGPTSNNQQQQSSAPVHFTPGVEIPKLQPPSSKELSTSSSIDLRDLLNKKRSAQHIAPPCCCQKLITSILVKCWCDELPSRASVFDWLLAASKSSKQCRYRCQVVFSDEEYPEASVNVVGRGQVLEAAS